MMTAGTRAAARRSDASSAAVTPRASRDRASVPTARVAPAVASRAKKKADPPPAAFAVGTPTRSETQRSGAREESAMRSVALDLGAQKISYCEVTRGKVVDRCTVSKLDELVARLGKGTPRACIAIEACREAWHVHDVLVSWGHEVQLVDTTRVKQLGIGAHRRKTDRIDAEVLAHAVERGAIPKAHLLSVDRRELRTKINVRAALVSTRSQFVTQVRGILRTAGTPVPSCAAEDFLALLSRASLPGEVRSTIEPLRLALATLGEQIVVVEAELRARCAKDVEMQRLATAPAVNVIVAASFVSVIDDAKRFHNAHQVAAYLGLVPSEDSSGERRRQGGITKHGNPYLRAMLVQAGWLIQRSKDTKDPLVRWAHAVAKRRGKKIAAIAVARRLACILWAMWRRATTYDPKMLAAESASGLHRHAQDVELQAVALERAAKKLRGPQSKTKRGPVKATA